MTLIVLLFDLGQVRVEVLVIKGFKIPVLEKGALGTEGLILRFHLHICAM